MLQLLHRLREHATQRGEAIAYRELVADRALPCSISYQELASSVAATAARLERLPVDAAIVISLPNTIECAIAFLAVLQGNRAAFLINPLISGRELVRAAEVSRAVAIFAEDETASAVPPLIRLRVERSPGGELHPCRRSDGAALLLLSSGTTQEPKIVYRDGPSLDAVARNCAQAIGVDHRDRILLPIPLCHSYGVEHGMLMALWAGATVHLCRGMEPGVLLPALPSGKVTIIPGVPSMYEMLAALREPLGSESIRCAYSAGAPLPYSVFQACVDRFGLPVGQLYGSSEVGSVTFNNPHRGDHHPTSVGQPMQGVEVRIVDPSTRDLDNPLPPGVEGEVAIQSPSMLRHYLGPAIAPIRDGFFFTEDLGRLSANGDLSITGRLKLLIDVGAMKVNPQEVEQTLKQHPAVADCLVIGVPISETVCRLKAMIVPSVTCLLPDAATLRAFVRERLSGPKVPRVIEFVEALPRSPTGKILRRVPVT